MSPVSVPLPGRPSGAGHDDQRDRELLLAVMARDEHALEQLYRLYRRPLTQFLWRLQPARDSIEEAINETFWVVWRQAHKFRGASRVSTWITGIAWRCALSAHRRNGGRSRDGAAEASGLMVATDALPLEPTGPDPQLEEEQGQWLAHGLSSLPLEQRATLELAYFLGHSCAEIAQIMECPVNTVKARMFQARIKLRNLLPKLDGSYSGASSGG